MSYIQYNGITLPCNQTTKFDHKSVYDDSNTDWMCNEYDIVVTSLVNINYLDVLIAGLPAGDLKSGILAQTNAASIVKAIRNALMVPRKQLSYITNGVDLIPSSIISGTVDARNGPRPMSCVPYYITGETFLFVYHIKAFYWENPVFTGSLIENAATSAVMRNRWTERVEIDEYDLSTRIRSGSFTIRSDNAEGLTADSLRNSFAVLSIPDGFLRTFRKYEVSEDGLTLTYDTTDKEQKKMPPYTGGSAVAAYKAKVLYTETATELGCVRFGTVLVYLVGSRISVAATLMDSAVRIGMNRFTQAVGTPAVDNGYILKGAEVSHDLYETSVTFKATVQYTQIRERRFGIAGFTTRLTLDPVSRTGTPTYYTRGFADLLLQAAAYYDPNIVENAMSKNRIAPTVLSKSVSDEPNIGTQMNNGREPGTG